ncbi:MAG: anti-sigma factor RsbA family regulatory protein [Solirubrobacterales bacterium]
MSCPARQTSGFCHEALFYADSDELLAGTVPFLHEGVEAGEAILVAMPEANLDLLRGNLNGETEQIQFVNMEDLGRNPARIIAAWRDFLGEHYSESRGVRGIGEPIWAGRSAAELDECRRHESLLNLAFVDAPAWSLLCPYDAANLDDEVLVAAEHSHPALSGRSRSAEFAADGGAAFAGELAPPAGDRSVELVFDTSDLHLVRCLVREQGLQAGLEEQRLDDLVLAAGEIATNSLRHGGGQGTVEIWGVGNALVCDFRDSGRIEDPLLGRLRPNSTQVGGRGLWLANQLCDLVQIRSNGTGSLVRLQMSI